MDDSIYQRIDRDMFKDSLPRLTLAELGRRIEDRAMLIGLNWGNPQMIDNCRWYIDAALAELRRRDAAPHERNNG